MARTFSSRPKWEGSSSTPLLGIGLFVCVTFLVALCAKHRRKSSRKCMPETNDPKVTPFLNKHKKMDNPTSSKHEETFEEGGLWQKAILMGEKCQPPEFSGVIYYDPHGNRVSELPRTPRTPRHGATLSDFISVRV